MESAIGIDLGTSKVALVLVDIKTRRIVESATALTDAQIDGLREGRSEQSVDKIFDAVDRCFKSIDPSLLSSVEVIGVTGQMHGVMLFNSSKGDTSNLITWQDQRCLEDGFLDELRDISGDRSINTGFGCATLAWLAKYNRDLLDRFDCASTVQDYLVSKICAADRVVTDPSDAASWGFFDIASNRWELEKVRACNIPESLLPDVVPCGSMAGYLEGSFAGLWGLPTGIPVVTPLGDNQASLYATLIHPEEEIALTLGTGGQLSVVLDSSSTRKEFLSYPAMELRPYVGGQYIAVAASLCGGRAFGWLPDVLYGWFKELGVECPYDRDALFRKLDISALENKEACGLKVKSSFLGERHDPRLRGEICGIDLTNFTLGNLFAALVRGTIVNLRDMLPEHVYIGKSRVVGSGNGLRRLSVAQEMVEDIFGMPLFMKNAKEEAAQGAALLAIDVVS